MAITKKEMITEVVKWFKFEAQSINEWLTYGEHGNKSLANDAYRGAVVLIMAMEDMQIITIEESERIRSLLGTARYDGKQNETITIHGININL